MHGRPGAFALVSRSSTHGDAPDDDHRFDRIFRAGTLARSFSLLARVLRTRRDELLISLVVVVVVVVLSASLMYLVEHEHPQNVEDGNFQSVPQSMWWAVITVTTIGYGDMFPLTTEGKLLGALVAFLGVCVFALPVGIIGAGFIEEIAAAKKERERELDAQRDVQAQALATGADPKGAEVAMWLHLGQDRVRSLAASFGDSTARRNHARALGFVLLETYDRAALHELLGHAVGDEASLEHAMGATLAGWFEAELGWNGADVARLFSTDHSPAKSAVDQIAGALHAVLDPTLHPSEQHRLRTMVLTLVGSAYAMNG